MIKYDKLWTVIRSKNLTKQMLNKSFNVSKSQLHRLQHNQTVSVNTIDRLCNILSCEVADIMEHIPDGNTFMAGMNA